MLSSQSRKGRKVADRQNPVLGQDVVKLLKTQDAGYVTTMLLKTKRARARLEQEFVLSEDQGAKVLGTLSNPEHGSHTVFVDSREEQRRYEPGGGAVSRPDHATRTPGDPPTSEEGDHADTTPPVHLPTAASNPPRRTADRHDRAAKHDALERTQRRKAHEARKSQLAALCARETDLADAGRELDLQRAKMSNSVGGTTKSGAKWKVRGRKR